MNESKKEHHLHIVLTTQQYQLLCCQAKECRLTKRAYLARLIEGRPVKARPKLRKKIEPNPEQPFYIQTVRGVGYRFNKEA